MILLSARMFFDHFSQGTRSKIPAGSRIVRKKQVFQERPKLAAHPGRYRHPEPHFPPAEHLGGQESLRGLF